MKGVDPVSHGAMPIVFFYPAAESARGARSEVGPYPISGAEDAPPAVPGTHPLVVVSHGHKGSMFGHYDLCEALARRGYIVGAAEHLGDSWRDSSGFRTDRTLLGRSYQASAVIDAVLADAALGPHVDRSRIGVAGFSAGGYTSLLLVGAHPDFGLVKGYCERHPKDVEVCSGGPVRMLLPQPTPSTADPRVKAAFSMAPTGLVFGPHSFDDVQAPVFLSWGTKDEVLLPEENAEVVRKHLRTVKGTLPIEGAGHYVFLPPCTPGLEADVPEICKDPPGVDRAAAHEQMNRAAVAFFDSALR